MEERSMSSNFCNVQTIDVAEYHSYNTWVLENRKGSLGGNHKNSIMHMYIYITYVKQFMSI